VRRQQLLALGLSDDAIDHRITNGELIPTYAGVYAVGHREPGPIPVAAAVVLACGDDAVLSHDSAAALWGLGPWPKRHEVIAPYQRRRTGIVSHRSTTLTPDHVTIHYGIPVTTPVRTICDIAPRGWANERPPACTASCEISASGPSCKSVGIRRIGRAGTGPGRRRRGIGTRWRRPGAGGAGSGPGPGPGGAGVGPDGPGTTE